MSILILSSPTGVHILIATLQSILTRLLPRSHISLTDLIHWCDSIVQSSEDLLVLTLSTLDILVLVWLPLILGKSRSMTRSLTR